MNISKIKNFDVSNGEGVGVSVFVSGCHFHCPGCFNEEAWDYDAGVPFDRSMMENIMEMMSSPFIDHLSVLGGEPLSPENLENVAHIIKATRKKFPDKPVWLWTGYEKQELTGKQKEVVKLCSFITYGRFVMSKRDISRRFSGSSNQQTETSDGKIIEKAKAEEK